MSLLYKNIFDGQTSQLERVFSSVSWQRRKTFCASIKLILKVFLYGTRSRLMVGHPASSLGNASSNLACRVYIKTHSKTLHSKGTGWAHWKHMTGQSVFLYGSVA